MKIRLLRGCAVKFCLSFTLGCMTGQLQTDGLNGEILLCRICRWRKGEVNVTGTCRDLWRDILVDDVPTGQK